MVIVDEYYFREDDDGVVEEEIMLKKKGCNHECMLGTCTIAREVINWALEQNVIQAREE